MRRPNRRTGIAILLLMCMMLTLLPVDVLARDENYDEYESKGVPSYEELIDKIPTSFPYTGQAVSFASYLPKDVPFKWDIDYNWTGEDDYTRDDAVEPGTYTAKIMILKGSGDGLEIGDEFYHDFTIVRETIIYDRIQFTANNYTGAYDGNPHSISLDVTTPGVSATYATTEGGPYGDTLPEFTEVGEYTVYYRLYKELHVTEWGSATVTITEPEVVEQEIEYTAGDYFGAYDGEAHSIALDVATEGVAVTYATAEDGEYTAEKPSFTEPGEYAVWFRLEKEGYATVVGSASVTIVLLSNIEYGVEGYSGYYDGAAHTIALTVTTEGVAVTYATAEDGEYTAEKPSFTEPGEYAVWFRLEKEGYATVVGSASVNIMERRIEYSSKGYTGYYDGKSHSISLSVSTPDATVTYATSQDGEYTAEKPSFTKVGTYTVWYRIEKEHYNTVEGSEVVKIQQLKDIDYSVNNYVGEYDGEGHTIALDITTSDVSVSYSTSKNGKYTAAKPSFTEPGVYTVWFQLKKSGYESIKDSATVTINKAEQILYFECSLRPVDVEDSSDNQTIVKGTGLIHELGDGELSWTSSDPEHIQLMGDLTSGDWCFNVSSDAWSDGYSPKISVTAAETKHYKAATAKCKFIDKGSMNVAMGLIPPDGLNLFYVSTNDLNTDNNYTLSLGLASPADVRIMSYYAKSLLGQRLFSSANISTLAFDAKLCDNQTGEEIHDRYGNLIIKTPEAIQQAYKESELACYAVHLRMPTPAPLEVKSPSDAFPTVAPMPAPTAPATPAPTLTASENLTTISASGDAVVVVPQSPSPSAASPGYTTPTPAGKSMSGIGLSGIGQTAMPTPAAEPTTTATSTLTSNASLSTNAEKEGASINSSGMNGLSVEQVLAQAANGKDSAAVDGTASKNHNVNIKIPSGINVNGIVVEDIVDQKGGSKGDRKESQDIISINKDPSNVNITVTLGEKDSNNNYKVVNSVYADKMAQQADTLKAADVRDPENLFDWFTSPSEAREILGIDVSAGNNTNLIPDTSLSPYSASDVLEILDCDVSEDKNTTLIPDTSLSPFLLIYGPKEAFSNLLTVRARNSVFTWDGEGHAVAAEPSIVEGTSIYYSLDLENWQTEAPAFTDVLWNEDGTVGCYQVYVLALNPDCDPAVCGYTVTIVPAE